MPTGQMKSSGLTARTRDAGKQPFSCVHHEHSRDPTAGDGSHHQQIDLALFNSPDDRGVGSIDDNIDVGRLRQVCRTDSYQLVVQPFGRLGAGPLANLVRIPFASSQPKLQHM